MIDILLKCVIFIAVSFILGYVIPFLKDKNIYNYAKIAVQAAEQIYKESGMGKEKFEYVRNWLHKKLNITDDDLKKIIESAVYEINKEKKDKTVS
jgi:DNA polymerase III sliding clamp (beta) subunit (PCNA family)